MATAISTLRFARRLKYAGVPPDHAEAIVDALGEELESEIATKGDLTTAVTGLLDAITRLGSSAAIIR